MSSNVAQAVQEAIANPATPQVVDPKYNQRYINTAQVLEFPAKAKKAKPAKRKMIEGRYATRDGISEYETRNGNRFLAQSRVAGRKPVSKSFNTRKEAEDWLAEQKVVGVAQQSPTVPESMTMADLFTAYLPLRESKLGKKNKYALQRAYARLIASPLGKVLVRDMSIKALQTYFEARLVNVKSSTTMNEFMYAQTALKRMTRWSGWKGFAPLDGAWDELMEDNLIADSDERDVRPEKGQVEALVKYFEEQEKAKHPKNWINIPMADIVRVAAVNGFRRGEIFELKWKDLDVEARVVEHFRKDSGAKEGRSWRRTPVLLSSLDIIMRQPRDVNDPEALIFPYNADTVGSRFADACLALGINKIDTPDEKKLKFHDLRHEAITVFGRKVKSDIEGMAISGHKSSKHYMRYVNLKKEDLTDISKQLDSITI